VKEQILALPCVDESKSAVGLPLDCAFGHVTSTSYDDPSSVPRNRLGRRGVSCDRRSRSATPITAIAPRLLGASPKKDSTPLGWMMRVWGQKTASGRARERQHARSSQEPTTAPGPPGHDWGCCPGAPNVGLGGVEWASFNPV
jgi:hypothetical protein